MCKKQQPSYTDTYACLSFEDAYDAYAGLAVTVKRVSDSKRFVLPLAHLKATEKPPTITSCCMITQFGL
jgi:hypothetical protein